MQMRNSLILMAAAIGTTGSARGQAEVDGPTALITTYRAKPELRAKLRSVMATEGVKQLDGWKKSGAFASYRLLFTTYAADSVPDMYLVVKFNHFTDLAKWQKIEETNPGGLPIAALPLASAETSGTADILKENSVAATTSDSQFFVLQYDVLVDMPKYSSYALGYATPQFDEWEKAGILTSYAAYVNQNPAGAPWGSFILLEYKDLKSLASREVVKAQARIDLGNTNPTWKKWSDDKTAIRKEKQAIPVRSLN